MATFISRIEQFELLLKKMNMNKMKETSGDNCEVEENLAEQVKLASFKSHWELLVIYLSSCFVCGFKSIDSRDEFQQKFMNLIDASETEFNNRNDSRIDKNIDESIEGNIDKNIDGNIDRNLDKNIEKVDKKEQEPIQMNDSQNEDKQKADHKKEDYKKQNKEQCKESNQNSKNIKEQSEYNQINQTNRIENGEDKANNLNKNGQSRAKNKDENYKKCKIEEEEAIEIYKDVKNNKNVEDKKDTLTRSVSLLTKTVTSNDVDDKRIDLAIDSLVDSKDVDDERIDLVDGKDVDDERIEFKDSSDADQRIDLPIDSLVDNNDVDKRTEFKDSKKTSDNKKDENLNKKETNLKNETNSEIDELKQETTIERLIRLVYQTTGIQEQIQNQIELIKLDLSNLSNLSNLSDLSDLSNNQIKQSVKRKIKFNNLKTISNSFSVEQASTDHHSQNSNDCNDKTLNQTDHQKAEQANDNCKLKNSPEVNLSSNANANQLNQYFIESNKSNLIKIHKSLEVRTDNKSKGRGIYIREESKNNFQAKDSLVVEIPFITWLDRENVNFCSNCFKMLAADDRLECEKCKAINYCSAECSNAFNAEHRFECEHLSILSKFGLFQMAVRVLMKEVHLVESDLISENSREKLESSIEHPTEHSTEHPSKKNHLVKLDENHNLETETNQLKSSTDKHLNLNDDLNLINFYSLDGHIHSNSFTILICFCLTSIFTSKFLRLIYEFDEDEFSVAVRLFRIALILRQNTMETYDQNGLPIGHALYLYSSLFNHACRPNCVRYFKGNQIQIVPKTSIPTNSELTITYGLDHNLSYKERREQLKERFGFNCLCVDCCKESMNDSDCKQTDV